MTKRKLFQGPAAVICSSIYQILVELNVPDVPSISRSTASQTCQSHSCIFPVYCYPYPTRDAASTPAASITRKTKYHLEKTKNCEFCGQTDLELPITELETPFQYFLF